MFCRQQVCLEHKDLDNEVAFVVRSLNFEGRTGQRTFRDIHLNPFV